MPLNSKMIKASFTYNMTRMSVSASLRTKRCIKYCGVAVDRPAYRQRHKASAIPKEQKIVSEFCLLPFLQGHAFLCMDDPHFAGSNWINERMGDDDELHQVWNEPLFTTAFVVAQSVNGKGFRSSLSS